VHCGTLAQPTAYDSDVISTRWPCPCCANRTLPQAPPGSYELCPVCFWEDDPVQFDDPDYEGGANVVSLIVARRNFQEFGASEQRFISNVRPPMPEEKA
jgi:hypothetical protein